MFHALDFLRFFVLEEFICLVWISSVLFVPLLSLLWEDTSGSIWMQWNLSLSCTIWCKLRFFGLVADR